MLSLLACLCMADADVVVQAPASLRKPFQEMQVIYEQRNPGTHLRFADTEGDALFSTDKAQMNKAVGRDVKPFAGDRVCLLVSEKAKNRVSSLQDLTQSGLRICMAKDSAETTEVLTKAAKKFGPTWLDQVRTKIVSFEANMSAVLLKVELGDVDAGFVFETDARGAKKATGYQIPKEFAVRATYYCGVPKESKNPAGAKVFVALVLSKEGQAILAKYGFLR